MANLQTICIVVLLLTIVLGCHACGLSSNNTVYRVTDHNCSCNVNATGTLRYRQQILQICNGQQYVDACNCNGNGKLGSRGNPATSCLEILENDIDSKSGSYYLKHNNVSYKTFCIMEEMCGSKGWTVIMKVDGTKSTFHYTSPYWMNQETYNEKVGVSGGLDDQETKLQSYTNFPFTMLCLGIRVSNQANWINIEHSAPSLHSVIADNQYRKTTKGREAWKSLINGSSLQTYCNLEGFNVRAGYGAMARIGILGNNENDCESADSRIGLGTSGYRCDQDDSNTAGNEARCSSDDGDKSIKGFGYLLGQTYLVDTTLGFAVNPGRSCRNIKLAKSYSSNGVYSLNLTGNTTVVYCHMDTICGSTGWTLIMKIDGDKQTFAYNSTYWTSRNVYNVESVTQGLNTRKEVKLSTYSEFAFSKLCLGMKSYDGDVRWISLPYNSSSLHSLISTDSYLATNIGRGKWKSLLSNSSLQMNCNREGFNVRVGEEAVRIGILSNDQHGCNSSESRIGFGASTSVFSRFWSSKSPHRIGNSTAGNEAMCDNADNGNQRIPALGYILAQ